MKTLRDWTELCETVNLLLDKVSVPIQDNFGVIVNNFTSVLINHFGTKLLTPNTQLTSEMEHYYNELERFVNSNENGQIHFQMEKY